MLNKYHEETIAIHGDIPRASGALQTPIVASNAFKFESSEDAAELFALKKFGFMYARLDNPTVNDLSNRLTKIHGGAGAFCTSSGHAAQLLCFANLMTPGSHIVASNYLYGGTITQLSHTFPKQFDWQSTLVDIDNLDEVKNAITPKTKAIFAESQANPNSNIADIEALATIAHDAGIPLIIDNTTATYQLCNPFDYGADIITYSLSKYISGNSTIIAGAVIDSGKFDWTQNDKFDLMVEPDKAYNNISFAKDFGALAFTVRGIAVGLRDFGTTMSPYTAIEALKGLETLEVRMDRHVSNTIEIVKFLEAHPRVKKVNSPALESSKYHDLAKKYFKKGVSGLLTAEIEGGLKEVQKFINELKVFIHCASLGDTRSLIIHPYSTTHSQLSDKKKEEAGIKVGYIRLSIGIENIDDLKADLSNALKVAFE